MNKFISAITTFNYHLVKQLVEEKPAWLKWQEKTGKNALHYLCGVQITTNKVKAKDSLQILQFLLKNGMDINAIDKIPEKNSYFPATPLWYAYTRGRNELLYTYLLKKGANPDHCQYAIAWNDDVKAAALFRKHGANMENGAFLAACYWRKPKMVSWFLKNGADVNYIGQEGFSALLLAVKRKAPIEDIKLLLSYGADINLENKEGMSPGKLAEVNRQRSILSYFKSWQERKVVR
jgi:ankyrin repeat protein